MPKKVVAVIFEGGSPAHPVVRDLAAVRAAVVLDTIAKLSSVAAVASIVLSTNYPALAAEARILGAIIHRPEGVFHYGRELQKIVRDTGAEAVISLGGAAAPYLTVAEYNVMADKLQQEQGIVITNNPQSADLTAFAPADAIFRIMPPAEDNGLATLLRDQAGLVRELLPHSLGVHFDLDTPTDALLMSLLPGNGPFVTAALQAQNWDTKRLMAALSRLAETHVEMGLIGRVSPQIMAHINSRTFVRLRVFSEERGMKALGRIERGQVRSLIGYFLETTGPEKFFSYLSQTCDVCFIDTRVFFAHSKLKVSEADRFLSDLGRYDEINHPYLREFTQAAAECAIPVILGGHSLVCGGMWAVVELLERPSPVSQSRFQPQSTQRRAKERKIEPSRPPK